MQNQKLIKLMKYRWVTPLLALNEVKCMRLAARVLEIKKMGYILKERWEYTESGKRVKAFKIVGKV